MIIEWNATFVTGNPTIDAQHKQLFKLLNDLHNSMANKQSKEVKDQALEAVGKYCVEHFSTEQKLMLDSNYPHYFEHKKLHDELTQQATQVIQDYKSGKLVLSLTLTRFLSGWITTHIGEEDKKFINWLHEQKKAA